MAEERYEAREWNVRQLLPWTVLFRGFQVALDPKKLALAAAGILVMALGWWLLAIIFYNTPLGKRPVPGVDYPASEYQPKNEADADRARQIARENAWRAFQENNNEWRLLHQAAGTAPAWTTAADLATSYDNYDQLQAVFDAIEAERAKGTSDELIRQEILRGNRGPLAVRWLERRVLPQGELRSWPWFEDRGPNPYLMITGQAAPPEPTTEILVLIEPLVKFLKPVIFLLQPQAGFWNRVYFLLVVFWTLATWAVFGGAITRMAAVQVARNEKIGLVEALRFVWVRKGSYLFASVAPLVFVAITVVLLALFGIGNWIPIFAEFWDGLLWPLVLLAGLAMAVVLVGLVGWPMIHATLSAEGSDSFDALSRSYSYVYQSPWHYLWYCLVSLAYGAVVVFFVGLMGSLMVYLGKWGVSQAPLTEYFHRDPSYMFVWAPTSYQWRDLLLQGSPLYVTSDYQPWNYIGLTLITFWLFLAFVLMIGFSYSYFWSASTIIYLLMRRKVDDTDLDEVYLEEEESEDAYTAPTGVAPPPPPPPAGSTSLTMVEPPALRTPPSPAPARPNPQPETTTDVATAPPPPAAPAVRKDDGDAAAKP